MADKSNDFFKPKLGRVRNLGGARAKTYINQVLHQISTAGKSGFSTGKGSRAFSGTRIGRGNDTLRHRRAGHSFGPSYRHVIIKTRIVKFGSGGKSGTANAHLRYIQRDGVSKEALPGQLYDATRDEEDGKKFLGRSEGDRHQFRFIVSPAGAEICGPDIVVNFILLITRAAMATLTSITKNPSPGKPVIASI